MSRIGLRRFTRLAICAILGLGALKGIAQPAPAADQNPPPSSATLDVSPPAPTQTPSAPPPPAPKPQPPSISPPMPEPGAPNLPPSQLGPAQTETWNPPANKEAYPTRNPAAPELGQPAPPAAGQPTPQPAPQTPAMPQPGAPSLPAGEGNPAQLQPWAPQSAAPEAVTPQEQGAAAVKPNAQSGATSAQAASSSALSPTPSQAENAAHAPPPSSTPTATTSRPAEGEGYVINFNEVNIIEYLRFVSKITGNNFIFDEADLNFNVTVVSKDPASVKDVMATLLQILETHGLAIAEQGNNVGIFRTGPISQLANVVSDELDNLQNSYKALVTRVFKLYNANPATVLQVLQPLVTNSALVQISPETRDVIVTDKAANIERVAQLVESLDSPVSNMQIGQYAIRNGYLDALLGMVIQIMNPLAGTNPFVLVPQASMNTIFIVSTPYLVQKAISLLQVLDVEPLPPEEGGPKNAVPPGHIDQVGFTTFKLQYQRGDDIQEALAQISKSLATAGNGVNQDLITAIGSAQWIDSINAIVFTATREASEKMIDLLKSLDVPLRQVLIEMVVIQTSLNNSFSFGVNWGETGIANQKRGQIVSGSAFLDPGNVTNATNGTQFGSNFQRPPLSSGNQVVNLGTGLNMGILGNLINHKGVVYATLGALISALETEADTDILLAPRIITEDNKEAEVFVGQDIPFSLGATQFSSTTTQATQSIEYRQVGTRLKVRPILGEGDLVSLEITQEISTLGSASTNVAIIGDQTLSTPTVNQSRTQTNVHVPDQTFLVISGMVSETKQRSTNRIPCLGALPGVGKVFGSESDSLAKSNVMIFLRPHIVTSSADMARLTQDQAKRYQESKKEPKMTMDIEAILKILDTKNDEASK